MNNVNIHPTAIVSEEAKMGSNIEVGAYSIIGPHVVIGNDCKIGPHVILDGHLSIGNSNHFYQFCSIGAPPQDMTYKGEPTRVEIGDNNTFREYVSVHRGTLKEDGLTKIGSNCLMMAYVHIGHDVIIGSNCTFANSVNCAGHVKIGDRVIIGGGTQVSQFVSMGRGAYIGGASGVDRDIPAFCTAYGNRVKLKGINIIGLRRQGYSKQDISEVVDFYRTMEASILSARSFIEHAELMQDYQGNAVIKEITEHIRRTEVGIAPFVA